MGRGENMKTTINHTHGKCQFCKSQADVEIGLGVDEPCAIFQKVCENHAREVLK